MFTWGGLTVRPDKGNRASDGALSREKSAEAIVPEARLLWDAGEGPNA